MAQFQYQSLAEPVRPGTAFTETTQLDKWYRQPVDPPRQIQRVTTITGLFSIDTKLLTQSERVDLDKWYVRPIDSPLQVKRLTDRECYDIVEVDESVTSPWVVQTPSPQPLKRLTDTNCLSFGEGVFTSESVTADRWCHFYPDYLRPLARITDRECLSFPEGIFTTESTTVDRWAHFYSDYIRLTPRLTDRECLDFGEGVFNVETTTVDRWCHFYVDYLRPLPRLTNTECLDYGEGVFTIESISIDRWNPLSNLPTRPSPRLTDRDGGIPDFRAVFVGVFNPSTGFPYIEPEPSPRQLKRLVDIECLDYGEGVFTTETTSVDRWYTLTSVSPRQSPRITNRDGGIPDFSANFTTAFNPGSGFPWMEVEPSPRQIKRLSNFECLDYGEGVFTTETTSLDKWWQPTSISPRKVQRLSDIDVGRPDFTDSILYPGTTGFPWTEIVQPPRPLKRELYSDGIFTTDTKKVVSIDSWIPIDNSPTSNHVKSYRGYFTQDTKQLTIAESTQLDKWWQPTSLPVRPPVRLTDSRAWYATLRDIIIIPIPPTVFMTGGIQTIVSMTGNSQRTVTFASNVAQRNVGLTSDAGSNS